MTTAVEKITSYGYKVESRAEFLRATAQPQWWELRKRVSEFPGAFVLWDPNDDCDGLLLIGDDPEALAREALVSGVVFLEPGTAADVELVREHLEGCEERDPEAHGPTLAAFNRLHPRSKP